MGVIHKLREDIVDFILSQKKSIPEISCRKLSEVIFKEYRVVVSKSSISTVLKNAKLSSPVGRHSSLSEEEPSSAFKPVSKFKIPEQKKKQIFPSPKPSSRSSEFSKSAEIQSPKIKYVSENKASVSDVENKKNPKRVIDAQSSRNHIPELSNLKPIEQKSPVIVNHLFDNAGVMLLKAAEWDLNGSSVLAKVIHDEVGDKFDIDFELFANFLLYPELFGQKQSILNNSRRLHGFFKISSNDDFLNPQVYSPLMTALGHIKDCGLKLAIEMQVLLKSVSKVKLVSQKGFNVYCDIKNKTVDFDNVQSDNSQAVSFQEAINIVKTDIIKNVHSAVFYYFRNDFENILKFLIGTFDQNKDDGLKKLILTGPSGEVFLEYHDISARKRNFVLALWTIKDLWPQKILPFLSSSENSKIFQYKSKNFYYRSLDSDHFAWLPKSNLNMIILKQSSSIVSEPLAILLTNRESDEKSIRKTIEEFLYSWPGLYSDNLYPIVPLIDREIFFLNHVGDLESCPTFPECISILRKIFQEWIKSRYSDSGSRQMLNNQWFEDCFYRLSGSIAPEDDRFLTFDLHVPKGHNHWEKLESILQRFNSRNVSDPSGRRVVFKISSNDPSQ